MNLYFLVEGKRTEKKVYPAWLSHLVPSLRKVDFLEEIDVNSYCIFSGEGYPSLIGVHFRNAVQDYRQSGKLDRLVVCLDVDQSTPNMRSKEVFDVARSLEFPLEQLRVITQESCIESWFLGNRKAVASSPQSAELSDYVQFYNVRRDDPESMGTFSRFNSRSNFHSRFFSFGCSREGLPIYQTSSRPRVGFRIPRRTHCKTQCDRTLANFWYFY